MKIHAVPIVVRTITRENLPTYLEQLKACDVKRVFLCGVGNVYCEHNAIVDREDDMRYAVNFFRSNGLEVGIWLGAFGHGDFLVGFHGNDDFSKYTSIVGVDGKTARHGLCPLDEKFRADYYEGLKRVAALGPDMIMFDDDFRMDSRSGYRMGCFCDKHKAMLFEKLGGEFDVSDMERLVFTGKRNKYRDAWMDGLGYSLELFAKGARAAVDEINPNIRMGACTNQENCDLSGTDIVRLAKIFAGKNKPFTRVCGAAYSFLDVTRSIEMTRLFFDYFEKEGIEVFSEGDVYPRPRYNPSSSSKQLELMNYALVANGEGNGELNYIVDYYQKPDYETGYLKRYEAAIPYRKAISEMFDGKRAVGVRAFNAIHKFREWELPDRVWGKPGDIEISMMRTANCSSVDMLAKNSIPTTFADEGYPVMLLGENARHFDISELGCGAILDAPAAKILQSRGVDVGLLSSEYVSSYSEYYVNEDDTIPNVDNGALVALECNAGAEVLTRFVPENRVSSYRYENAKGARFIVLGYDGYLAYEKKNFINNYYRQKHLMDAVEWICSKPLPVVSYKNPSLYTLVKRDSEAMAVMLVNNHLDDVITPTFKLDREYKSIRFINCSGELKGDTVYLSEKLHGYDFAAFEVK